MILRDRIISGLIIFRDKNWVKILKCFEGKNSEFPQTWKIFGSLEITLIATMAEAE